MDKQVDSYYARHSVKSLWQLHDAKKQFGTVVKNAMNNGAQTITRHGKPVVVVLSAIEYERLRPRERTLVEILRSCPVKDLKIGE